MNCYKKRGGRGGGGRGEGEGGYLCRRGFLTIQKAQHHKIVYFGAIFAGRAIQSGVLVMPILLKKANSICLKCQISPFIVTPYACCALYLIYLIALLPCLTSYTLPTLTCSIYLHYLSCRPYLANLTLPTLPCQPYLTNFDLNLRPCLKSYVPMP